MGRGREERWPERVLDWRDGTALPGCRDERPWADGKMEVAMGFGELEMEVVVAQQAGGGGVFQP